MSAEPNADSPGAPSRRGAVDPESPWLGLRSFTEDTRAYFFGRDAELQDLSERVVHKPLTVLFGQSGLGKTSLLQAALIPRLREQGYLPILLRLDHAPGAPAPERQLLAALRAVLRANDRADLAGFPEDIESLWLLLHDPQYGFIPAPAAATPPSSLDIGHWSLPAQPVFLFDQFEEIFTLGERPERRDASLAFRDALAGLVENRPPAALRARLESDDDLAERLAFSARPAKVLLTLREDFLHILERWRRQMPSLMDNRLELRLLTGPQALQAVIAPGRMRGADQPPIVSDDTGAAIVRFVAGVRDDVPLTEIDAVPPLLSLICAELNARRFGPDGDLAETVQAEQLQGQSADILEGFYAGAFADVPGAARELVENRLLSADGFRESLALDTAHRVLETAGVPPADARVAISTLVDHRLLVVEERGGVRRVELTHDVLTGVACTSRDERQARETEQNLVAARRRVVRERQRARRVIAGTSMALVASLALAAFSYFQYRRATNALSRAKEAQELAEEITFRLNQEQEGSKRLIYFMVSDLSRKLRPDDLLGAISDQIKEYWKANKLTDQDKAKHLTGIADALFKIGEELQTNNESERNLTVHRVASDLVEQVVANLGPTDVEQRRICSVISARADDVLRRQKTVHISLVGERNRSDYATAVFTMLEALPGDRTAVPVEPSPISVELNALPATADLPTGIYRVNLQGAGGRADTTVQSVSLLGGLVVRAGDSVVVRLPPSFAGRYQQEFLTRVSGTSTTAVTRVLIIEPGLSGGHMDDSYVPTINGVRSPAVSLRGVPIGGLRLDERGALHGLIHFTQLGGSNASYDEQFEITYSPQTRRLTIQGGDWEVEPDTPALAAQLLWKLGRAPHKSKPPPRLLDHLEEAPKEGTPGQF